VCEMLAGLLLGPSCFGLLAPTLQRALFPTQATVGGVVITHPSMSILYVIAHLGIALYMFLVGLEFETQMIRKHALQASVISAAGMVTPVVLGSAYALVLYQQGDLFGAGVSPLTAALFLGAALSITAFPMLARILQQYHQAQTQLGALVLTVAAAEDIAAWCLLAVVLATLNHSPIMIIITVGGGALYTAGMLTVGRYGLRLLGRMVDRTEHVSQEVIVLTLLVVLLCAWLTTQIGIYELFGAFVAGVAMPRGRLAETLRQRLETITSGLLVPVFFVYAGLNVRLTLIDTPNLWLATAIIIGLALLGKVVACALAARVVKFSWRDSLTVGALMNARGLIELILLAIGLETHIISPTLFAMLTLMALITTLLTTPLYRWLSGRRVGQELRTSRTDTGDAQRGQLTPA